MRLLRTTGPSERASSSRTRLGDTPGGPRILPRLIRHPAGCGVRLTPDVAARLAVDDAIERGALDLALKDDTALEEVRSVTAWSASRSTPTPPVDVITRYTEGSPRVRSRSGEKRPHTAPATSADRSWPRSVPVSTATRSAPCDRAIRTARRRASARIMPFDKAFHSAAHRIVTYRWPSSNCSGKNLISHGL